MRYQNPQLLYALFAIIVPIVLHFINLRKHKIVNFSSIRFLKQIKEEKRKQSKLRDLLILLSRILAITFLVIAFSKPYIPDKNKEIISKNICIYIDNSFSMDATDGNIRLLDYAKKKAKEIIQNYPEETEFQLLTNDYNSTSNRIYNKQRISILIDNTISSPNHISLNTILKRTITNKENPTQLYVLSDMQKNTLKVDKLDPFSDIICNLIPVSSNNIRNVSIDSCWFSSPLYHDGSYITLKVRLHNHYEKDQKKIPIILKLNNQQKSQQLVDLSANEIKEVEFKFINSEAGIQEGEISIQDFPISFDNKIYFTFTTQKRTNVLYIHEKENKSIRTLFGRDSLLCNYISMPIKEIRYELISKQNLIILDQINKPTNSLLSNLEEYMKVGGSLVVTPTDNIESINRWLSNMKIDTFNKWDTTTYNLSNINHKHPLFKNVFDGKLDKINLPQVFSHYSLKRPIKSKREVLLSLENGDEFLNTYKIGSGSLYLFTSDFSSSNFSNHALFVPTWLNIANNNVDNKNLYYIIGKDEIIDLPIDLNNEEVIHVKNNSIDVIGNVKLKKGRNQLFISNQINMAGNYRLEKNNMLIGLASFNYNKQESICDLFLEKDLKKYISTNKIKNLHVLTNDVDMKSIITNAKFGKEFWRIALILTLFFLALETVLIKILKS